MIINNVKLAIEEYERNTSEFFESIEFVEIPIPFYTNKIYRM